MDQVKPPFSSLMSVRWTSTSPIVSNDSRAISTSRALAS